MKQLTLVTILFLPLTFLTVVAQHPKLYESLAEWFFRDILE